MIAMARRPVDLFDQPGLFVIRTNQPEVVPAVDERLASLELDRRGPVRVKPPRTGKSGLHRYCSACAHETEHVAWSHDGRGSIPSIRWPSGAPAVGTTICLNCGQWRAATSRHGPPVWSNWPRKLIATEEPAIESGARHSKKVQCDQLAR